MSIINKKILELRDSKNLTQEQFAKIFNVSKEEVNKWENTTEPNFGKLSEICDFFDVPLDYFREDFKTNKKEEKKLKANKKSFDKNLNKENIILKNESIEDNSVVIEETENQKIIIVKERKKRITSDDFLNFMYDYRKIFLCIPLVTIIAMFFCNFINLKVGDLSLLKFSGFKSIIAIFKGQDYAKYLFLGLDVTNSKVLNLTSFVCISYALILVISLGLIIFNICSIFKKKINTNKVNLLYCIINFCLSVVLVICNICFIVHFNKAYDGYNFVVVGAWLIFVFALINLIYSIFCFKTKLNIEDYTNKKQYLFIREYFIVLVVLFLTGILVGLKIMPNYLNKEYDFGFIKAVAIFVLLNLVLLYFFKKMKLLSLMSILFSLILIIFNLQIVVGRKLAFELINIYPLLISLIYHLYSIKYTVVLNNEIKKISTSENREKITKFEKNFLKANFDGAQVIANFSYVTFIISIIFMFCFVGGLKIFIIPFIISIVLFLALFVWGMIECKKDAPKFKKYYLYSMLNFFQVLIPIIYIIFAGLKNMVDAQHSNLFVQDGGTFLFSLILFVVYAIFIVCISNTPTSTLLKKEVPKINIDEVESRLYFNPFIWSLLVVLIVAFIFIPYLI